MFDAPGRISVSLTIEPNCEIRKKFCPEDVTFWLETPNGAFDMHIRNDGSAEMLRDLFTEAVAHFARMDSMTDEEIEAEEQREEADRMARFRAEFANSR